MKVGTFRQQIGFTFIVASVIASLVCDYIWAYHCAPYDLTFPTPWSVFELSVNISAVVVCITTALFVAPLFAVSGFKAQSPQVADYVVAAILGIIVQPVIFVSPHVTDRVNPFLAVLVMAPILAGGTFVALRRSA